MEDNEIIELQLEQLSIDDKRYCLQMLGKLAAIDNALAGKDNNADPLVPNAGDENGNPDRDAGLEKLLNAGYQYYAAIKALEDDPKLTTAQTKERLLVFQNKFENSVAGLKVRIHYFVYDVEFGNSMVTNKKSG